MTECLSVPETFVSEFSGWPTVSPTLPRRVRLTIVKATMFRAPLSNQEFDVVEVDKWVAVDEEHGLNGWSRRR